ncbi:hypothetical protein SAMN05216359_105302 [Roseateles sp. YR242]|uniref:hypothetical protein n=1 Tax=Roseateles sp. YR242 TaxID=1855305 RepID=UPI0008BF030B|nr:hypothetical protein [Roseateles sp. YR242]SEL12935.1 hypothetical protein SAMN05216359_105302 [Roseateles sp. YR242]
MNAFSTNYVPVMPGPTAKERAAAVTSRKLAAMNQAKLDLHGPSPAPTLTAAQKQAGRDKDRAIRAGRRV